MAKSNPAEILLAHHLWANRKMIEACAALTPEQFHQRFEMGPGSMHDAVTHILGALRSWTDFLATREMRPRLEGTQRSIAELSALSEEIHADFATTVAAHPFEETLSRVRDGKSYTFTRGAILTHVTTHSMHHRAQGLNMLRHLGIKPLPASSVLEWTIMGESA